MKTFSWLIIMALLAASCNTIKPDAPNLPLSNINSTPLQDSKIDVPVTIDMAQVFNDFNSKIPIEFSGDGAAGPGQYRWDLKREPFNLSLSGDTLHIMDAAHCDGGGYIKNPFNHQWNKVCSCDVDVNMGISAKFALSNNYSLSGNAVLTDFDLSACDLKIVNLNITPLLKPRAVSAINDALAGFNKTLSQYNFRQVLQPAWDALNRPIKIADIGYIALNPEAIRLLPPTGSGNLLKLSAGITAKPVFSLADPGKSTSPIPDISNVSGDGFNLDMDIHLDYKPLNTILKNTVTNKRIMTGENGYIDIKDAEIYGSGNEHLFIKVTFSGKKGIVPYHGNLYFTCMPVYDANSGNLYINSIDFDVNTIDKLKEGPAAWILTPAMKAFFNSAVHFNIGGQINAARDKLNQAINQQVGPNITLSGKVDSLSLQGILPAKDYLLVRISTSGNLAVKVN